MAVNFKKRSTEKEILDDFELEGNDLRKNLRELEKVNGLLGGYQVVKSGIEKLKRSKFKDKKSLQIADIGCGGGDSLRYLAKWGRKKGVDLSLIGIDANHQAIEYGEEKSEGYPEISFEQVNIFSPEFEELQADIWMFNLCLHHFTDDEIIGILKKAKKMGASLMINDIHRHPLGYHAFRLFSRLMNFSYIGRHDGKISIRKAFIKEDWLKYLKAADINRFEISWKWAFRYQVIVY